MLFREDRMSRDDKREIRRQALREAVRFCGGVQAYSKLLGLGRARVSNWINQDINMPYEYAIMTEQLLKISLDRLSPFTEKANEIVRSWRNKNKFSLTEVSINEVVANQPLEEASRRAPIIIDPQGVLIAGVEQFHRYKTEGREKVSVIVLDLEHNP